MTFITKLVELNFHEIFRLNPCDVPSVSVGDLLMRFQKFHDRHRRRGKRQVWQHNL